MSGAGQHWGMNRRLLFGLAVIGVIAADLLARTVLTGSPASTIGLWDGVFVIGGLALLALIQWWYKRGGQDSERVDYYEEGLALIREERFHEALTSLRLALQEAPGDTVVLQQIAIAYTRIGMTEEASKTYRHVLQKDPAATGARYGLAYLLLRRGEEEEAVQHLEIFLTSPPNGPEAAEHIAHARSTLAQLRGEPDA